MQEPDLRRQLEICHAIVEAAMRAGYKQDFVEVVNDCTCKPMSQAELTMLINKSVDGGFPIDMAMEFCHMRGFELLMPPSSEGTEIVLKDMMTFEDRVLSCEGVMRQGTVAHGTDEYDLIETAIPVTHDGCSCGVRIHTALYFRDGHNIIVPFS